MRYSLSTSLQNKTGENICICIKTSLQSEISLEGAQGGPVAERSTLGDGVPALLPISALWPEPVLPQRKLSRDLQVLPSEMEVPRERSPNT